MEKYKTVNALSIGATSIAGLFALAFVFSNIFGLWQVWHLSGYAYFLLVGPIAMIVTLATSIYVKTASKKETVPENCVSLNVSLCVGNILAFLISILVFSKWMW